MCSHTDLDWIFLHELLCADFRFLMWITLVLTVYSRLFDSYICSGVCLLQFLILYEPWLLVFYVYYTFPVLSANMYFFFYAIICWEEAIRNVNLSLLFREALSEVFINYFYTPCKPCGKRWARCLPTIYIRHVSFVGELSASLLQTSCCKSVVFFDEYVFG